MVVVGVKKDFGAEAARLAGYKTGHKQEAYRLMRNPRVLEAIREEAGKRLQASALLGAMVLEEIALDPLHKDRLKAATELLNRGGMQLVEKHEHIVKDERNAAELVQFIKSMAQKNNLDPRKLLGQAEPVEAEFTEVPCTDEKPLRGSDEEDDDFLAILSDDDGTD
jgi:phage terminase small subunit